MSYKKIISLSLLLCIITVIFLSCNKNEIKGDAKENENVVTERIECTFDKLVQESDCCVLVSVNPKEQEKFNSKVENGEYFTDVKVESFSEYSEDYNFFPERITVIQKGTAFLEETNADKKTRFYYLFLNKTIDENVYYLTNNKSGVIETNFSYLCPLDENLSKELNQKFTHNHRKPDSLFRNWLVNEYEFSSAMYETTETFTKDDFTNITTTNLNTTPDIS